MGERVAVGRVTPAEPVDQPGARSEPLNYGRGDRAGNAWRWSRAWGAAALAAAGGGRRALFAIGLACLLGGLGDCIGGSSDGAGAFWMFVGGLLIGLTARVPLRGNGSE